MNKKALISIALNGTDEALIKVCLLQLQMCYEEKTTLLSKEVVIIFNTAF